MINGSESGGVEELVDRKEENRRRGDGGNRRAFYTSTSTPCWVHQRCTNLFLFPSSNGKGGCGGRAVPLWTQESDAMTSINATVPTATPASTLDSQLSMHAILDGPHGGVMSETGSDVIACATPDFRYGYCALI